MLNEWKNAERSNMGNVSIRTMLWAALVTLVAGGVAAESAFGVGAEGKPLLAPSMQSIYQRVLPRPGARLVAGPEEIEGKPLAAFSRLYVYERCEVGGQQRPLVGSGSEGKMDGWVTPEVAIPWKQQMALAFTPNSSRSEYLQLPDPAP